MGHCNTITGFKIFNFNTFGDFIKDIGIKSDLTKYYEYPDSVYLRIEKIKELPKYIHNKNCYGEKIENDYKLNKDNIYIYLEYYR